MAVLYITSKLAESHQSIIEGAIKHLGHRVAHIDMPHRRPADQLQAGDTIVSFGKLPATMAEQAIKDKGFRHCQHIKLAHPRELVATQQNKTHREEAFNALNQLKISLETKRFQPTGLLVTEEDLPELEAKQLLLLEKLTDKAGESSCFQTTKGGKLIEIGINPKQDSNADIFLTFEEIYTIRAIMDILQVESIDLCRAENQK